MKKMSTAAMTLLIALCASGLGACSKSDDAPKAQDAAARPVVDLAGLASPEKQQQIADRALPQGDAARPLADYRGIDSGNDVMFLYYGISKLPVDYDKAAQYYSRDYQNTSDGFKKQDMLNTLKPRIDASVAAAQNSRYVVLTTPNATLDSYDFTKKGFQLTNVAQPGSFQYFFDNANYKIAYTNGPDFNFVKVTDEAQARSIEDLRSHYKPITARVYAYAQDIDPANNQVKLQMLHVQLLDGGGHVLAAM
ncbi:MULTISPECIES: hypothetical protein [Burkholderia]|uniref:DUF4852 domain-containing protein n=1 Tax=Burkholderia aenigmatica TaxID=2015348 RepID=A0A6J5IPQ9_9BURK|nr:MULTISPECIES: hypothetical protein [Burkholderia]CAB3961705.1 hypothetical protein BLA3211_01352 [Burkholderia aenigmatica]